MNPNFDANSITELTNIALKVNTDRLKKEQAQRTLEDKIKIQDIISKIPEKCQEAAKSGYWDTKVCEVNYNHDKNTGAENLDFVSTAVRDYCVATFGKLRTSIVVDSYKQRFYLQVSWKPILDEDLKTYNDTK